MYFLNKIFFQGEVELSIRWYQESVASQDDWPQFHHLCYWDLFWASTYNLDWSEARKYSKMLFEENKWSKCTYAYQTAATMCMQEDSGDLTEEQKKEQIELMK